MAQAQTLVQAAQAHAAKEDRIMAEIATGAEYQSWLHPVLEAKGLDAAEQS